MPEDTETEAEVENTPINPADFRNKEISGMVPPYYMELSTLRVVKGEFKVSDDSGKPRIDLYCEILAPLTYKTGNAEYRDLNKSRLKFMLFFNDENLPYTIEFHEKLGLPIDNIVPNDPDTEIYKGVVFDYMLSSKEDFFSQLNPETRKREAKKDAKGNKISQGWSWNIGMINAMSLPAVQGRNNQDWSHLPF